jgi:hypothetical protein
MINPALLTQLSSAGGYYADAKRIAQASKQHAVVVDICMYHSDEIEQEESTSRSAASGRAGTSTGLGASSGAGVGSATCPLVNMLQTASTLIYSTQAIICWLSVGYLNRLAHLHAI